MCHCKKHKTHKSHKTRESRKSRKHHKTHENKGESLKVQLVALRKNFNTLNTSGGVPDSIWITGAPLFWNSGNRGENVNIGIIDTGVDDSHPVLKGKVVKSRNYVNDGASKSQYDSHGTHVAGTICADSVGLKGVAPKARIFDYRVLDRNGSGTYDGVTRAINDAVSDGCHVINMSLGGSTGYTPMHNAIKNAVSKGVLVVVAAGNEGPGKISYPANYPEVVSVGAVEYDSKTGNLTVPQTPWFSNTNPQVDISADGWNVYSCIPGNKYASYSGTSMATPCIAGFAALLRNKLKSKLKRDPTENELYIYLKSTSYEVKSLNATNLLGSGFATIYPELPKKDNTGKWYLPYLELNKP